MDNQDLDIEQELVERSKWMIRPCEVYIKEYSECSSFKSRFDQYYVDGKFTNCSPWQADIQNCRKWHRDLDYHAAASLLKNEKERVKNRLKSFAENDVMKLRKIKPPLGWNAPLPQHLAEKHKNSYLANSLEDLKKPSDSSSFCSIM